MPEIPQVYLPSALKKGTYSPRLYAAATVRFRDRKRKVEEVARAVTDAGASLVIFDEELSPVQGA